MLHCFLSPSHSPAAENAGGTGGNTHPRSAAGGSCPRWASRPARLELRVSEVPGKPLPPSRLVRRPFEQTNGSREGRTALWHSGAEEGGGK